MERLFSSITEFVNDLGPDAAAQAALMFAAWRQCAGTLLSERTAAIRYERNKLTVAVENDTWRKHLEDLSPQMLIRLNRSVGQGSVTRIIFEIDAAAIGQNRSRSNEPDVCHNSAAVPELDDAASSITDDDLRNAFLGAAGACLTRNES